MFLLRQRVSDDLNFYFYSAFHFFFFSFFFSDTLKKKKEIEIRSYYTYFLQQRVYRSREQRSDLKYYKIMDGRIIYPSIRFHLFRRFFEHKIQLTKS